MGQGMLHSVSCPGFSVYKFCDVTLTTVRIVVARGVETRKATGGKERLNACAVTVLLNSMSAFVCVNLDDLDDSSDAEMTSWNLRLSNAALMSTESIHMGRRHS